MSPVAKGRWVGLAAAALVTIAWWAMATEDCCAGTIILGGVTVGVPIGLVVGTKIGRFAGALDVRRWRVLVVGVASMALADLPSIAIVDADRWGPPLPALVISSLVIGLTLALVLEQWTRPAQFVPRARVEH
jgi:hypothetical protein